MRNIFKYIFALAAVSMLVPAVANAQAMDPQSPVDTVLNGLHLSVQPFYDPTTQSGKFRIESFVEGSITISTEMPPLDVVFIVDDAGAMNGGITGYSSVYDALKGLVSGFLNEFSSSDDIDVALIVHAGGSTGAYLSQDFTSTHSLISDAIGDLSGNGGGGILAPALDIAYGLLNARKTQNQASGREAQTLVIDFSGGKLTNTNLVKKAYDLKSDFNALFVSALLDGNQDKDADQTLMDHMSSNWPDARSDSSLGDRLPDDKAIYYKFSNSYSEFESFFSSLATEVAKGGSTIEVGNKALVRAAFTPSFTVPAEHTTIVAYQAPLTGIDDTKPNTAPAHFIWGTEEDITSTMTITDNDNKVSISGFNYGYNFCGLNAGAVHGYKLITEIYFQMNNTLGPDVTVFDPDVSGFYDDEGNKLLSFPDCNVHLAAIKVVKEGLKTGETAMFQLFDKDNNLISTFAVKGASDDGTADSIQKVVILSLIPTYNYTVKEITDWRWTYNDITTKSVTHPVVIGQYTEFRFGPATAKSGAAKNAENDKLNILIPPSGI